MMIENSIAVNNSGDWRAGVAQPTLYQSFTVDSESSACNFPEKYYQNGGDGLEKSDEHQTQTHLRRISCFLAGELEVPDDTPGWSVLCHPSQGKTPLVTTCAASTSSEVMGAGYNSKDAVKRPYNLKRKNRGQDENEMQKVSRTDIRIPLVWEASLLALWEHALKYSFVSQAVCREAFVERIRRIASLAACSIEERGFFIFNHLLGFTHASEIHRWALESWKSQPQIFRPGKLCASETSSTRIRRDRVYWFNPNDMPATPLPGYPQVRLLILYVDAIVRAITPSLSCRNGQPAVISERSWSALSSYQKETNGLQEAVGYISHYDNPEALSDGRVLTALYYLNPVWKKSWGGQLILWPRGKSTKLVNPTDSQESNDSSRPLAILPTLDRLVLFYADERILHRVQPVLPCSERNERLAIVTWYLDRAERMEYLSKTQHA